MNHELVGERIRCIVEAAHPDKIILFGSRARGGARPD
jgi:predicted nucleotidyltransferase